MQFTWQYTNPSPIRLKTFLKQKGISRRLLARIKYDGGTLLVNDIEQTVRFLVTQNDIITVITPDEVGQDNVIPIDMPIDILFEDDHYLIVNKPALTASIPSYLHPKYSMANRVKGYYVKKQYPNQVIHVVTRLDRDTTGVMLFAKHKLAHALLDEQLRLGLVDKRYIALAQHSNRMQKEGIIELPIERDPHSIVTRQIAIDDNGQWKASGKYAKTQYWEISEFKTGKQYFIKLHTGRTHQIRVHFNYMGASLIGDSLYNGRMDTPLQRQALHCQQISFYHAFLNDTVCVQAPLPQDMQLLLNS